MSEYFNDTVPVRIETASFNRFDAGWQSHYN
ncbi:hypothetical protein SAMN05421685_109132 [Thalassovita mediterranea]|nr:hypothetical protein SAMN05421685_109132 [Thalassovita mediterranea]